LIIEIKMAYFAETEVLKTMKNDVFVERKPVLTIGWRQRRKLFDEFEVWRFCGRLSGSENESLRTSPCLSLYLLATKQVKSFLFFEN